MRYVPSVYGVSAGFACDCESAEESVGFEGADVSLEGAKGNAEAIGDKPHIGVAVVSLSVGDRVRAAVIVRVEPLCEFEAMSVGLVVSSENVGVLREVVEVSSDPSREGGA